ASEEEGEVNQRGRRAHQYPPAASFGAVFPPEERMMSASHVASFSAHGHAAAAERKPAVAYFRVSTEKQYSLPPHPEWANRIVQRDGLMLAGEFEDEGFSGADFERPGVQELVTFVEKRFYERDPVQSLVVIDIDRLSRRNSMDTSALLGGLSKHGLRYL